MDTMEMISKALEAVVEQKVAEKATAITIDSVLEFIKNADRESLNNMLIAIGETSIGSNLIQDIVERKIEEDETLIYKDGMADEDVIELVGEHGLEERIFEEHWDDLGAYNQKEFIKDAIDNL